jgi:polar amino acid transport system substrate-binding protein
VKRLLPLLAVAALIAVPVAVAASASSPPVLHPGKLVVAFGDPTPGFAVGKVRGTKITNPKGYEVDLAKDVAAKLHLTPVWVYSPWTSLFLSGSKKFDVSFQEATATAQRKRTVDMTTGYATANQGVLLSPKAKVPHSLADLKKMQTCAQSDTTSLIYLQRVLKPVKQPHVYPTTTAAYEAVHVGTCQAFILDVALVSLEKKSKPAGYYGPVAGQIVTHESYGAVLQKNSKLTPIINGVLKKLNSNGTIGKLQKKWFNINFATIPVLK